MLRTYCLVLSYLNQCYRFCFLLNSLVWFLSTVNDDSIHLSEHRVRYSCGRESP